MSLELTGLHKEVISGLTAGTVTTVVTHPLDLIKVRLQLLAMTKPSEGYREVLKYIAQDSRNSSGFLREAYRGLGVNLIGNSIAWGLYFGLYRYSKDIVFRLWADESLYSTNSFQNDKQMGALLYMTSAGISGLTTTILTNPIWVVKTRIMSTSVGARGSYRSTWDGIKKLYKSDGVKGFWKGMIPSLFGVTQGALYFAVYDSLKHQYFAAKHIDAEQKLGNLETITITSLSKMISVTAVYPFQLLKANLQSFEASVDHNSYRLWSVIHSIYSKEGVKGLYKGLSANLLRAIPSTCITFCIYENLRHSL
ncbi:LAFE_0E12310g1_1 [Lachancea fermentati]|uniref:LAFE_0E12310g1_1 n=1 Tax=Lachancea fermentati TaxID=4955 RepID=A0A1G4MDT7_LACFM|nr:LAFE_0E12310g1_1 [Lachancea fermentati]